MYSKLFSSILDSSVWLESMPTRIVWLTLLAAKDKDGFARFASVENLSRRAVLSVEDTEIAVRRLESPDPRSSNPDNEGRRVERIPGGWVVLNAKLYDGLVKAEDERRLNSDRVRKHRQRKAEAEVQAPAQAKAPTSLARTVKPVTPFDTEFAAVWDAYPRRAGGNSRAGALAAFTARRKAGEPLGSMMAGVERYRAFCEATGKVGTEYVKQAQTFFGTNEHWKDEFPIPVAGSSAGGGHQSKADRTAAVLNDFLANEVSNGQ